MLRLEAVACLNVALRRKHPREATDAAVPAVNGIDIGMNEDRRTKAKAALPVGKSTCQTLEPSRPRRWRRAGGPKLDATQDNEGSEGWYEVMLRM